MTFPITAPHLWGAVLSKKIFCGVRASVEVDESHGRFEDAVGGTDTKMISLCRIIPMISATSISGRNALKQTWFLQVFLIPDTSNGAPLIPIGAKSPTLTFRYEELIVI
jgi:hypothetical protein